MGKVKRKNYNVIVGIAYFCILYEGASNMLLSASKELLSGHLGVGVGQIGQLITIRNIVSVATLLFAGALSDRFGRKPLIAGGILLCAGYYFVAPSQTKFLVFVPLVALLGLAYGLSDPSGQALLFDSLENPLPAMTFFQIAYAAGSFIIPLATSFVLKNNIPWKYLYYGFGAVGIIFALFLMLQKYPPLKKGGEEQTAQLAFVKEPKWGKEGITMMVLIFFTSVPGGMLGSWTDTYTKTAFSLPIEEAVKSFSFYQLGCMVGALTMFFLVKRVDVPKLMLICTLGTFASFSVGLLAGNYTIFKVMLTATGIFAGTIFSICVGYAGRLFWKRSGHITSLLSMAASLSHVMCMSLTGYLLGKIGIELIFKVVPGAMLIAVVLAVVVFVQNRRLLGRDKGL